MIKRIWKNTVPVSTGANDKVVENDIKTVEGAHTHVHLKSNCMELIIRSIKSYTHYSA